MRLDVSKKEVVEGASIKEATNPSNLVFRLATIFVIGLSYWYIDHNWEASSLSHLSTESYTGDENYTADKLSQVNTMSTVFRLVLAMWGCVSFVIAPKSKLRTFSPLLWCFGAVGLILFASILWSERPTQTLFKLTVLLTMIIAAVGVAAALSLREFFNAITIVCVGFILIGVVAEIAQGYFRPSADYRFIGTTHPNTEAIYASMLCLTARMFLDKLSRTNLLGVSIFVFGLIVVWYTKSRTTLAGLLFSLLATQTLVMRGSNRVLLIAGFLLAASVGLVGLSIISQSSSGSLGELATMGRKDDVLSLSGRLPLWEELLSSINKRPILGYGYLAYWDAKRVEYLSATFRWEIPHGHNLYLDTMLDIGIVGLGLVILAIMVALSESARYYSLHGLIEYAILFGLIVYGVINGFAESLFKLPGFPLFVALTGCFIMLKERRETLPRSRVFGSVRMGSAGS